MVRLQRKALRLYTWRCVDLEGEAPERVVAIIAGIDHGYPTFAAARRLMLLF
jgi:hypothetical protein